MQRPKALSIIKMCAAGSAVYLFFIGWFIMHDDMVTAALFLYAQVLWVIAISIWMLVHKREK